MSFTPIEIDQLLDGENTRTRNSVAAFQQAGVTFKGSIRSNPPKQINILNQAQLEAELGVDLIIPDVADLTIVLDAAFTLTKPIKIGNDAFLEIKSSTLGNIITYTGPGELFQLNQPGDIIFGLILRNTVFAGDGTNDVFGIAGNPFGILQMDNVNFGNFKSMGETSMPSIIMNTMGMSPLKQGLVIRNLSALTVNLLNLFVLPSDSNFTALSIIPNVNPSKISISNVNTPLFNAGDSIVNFNSIIGSTNNRFKIRDCDPSIGDVYQQGTDIAVTLVVDNTSGNPRFNTSTPHGLSVGTVTKLLSDFTDTEYKDKIVVVTAVDTPLTGTTFDVAELTFTGNDAGTMNKSSLDQSSILVTARDNDDSLDSESHAEARTGATLTVDGSGGVDVPVVDITPAPGDWIQDPNTQEFSVDELTGLITYIGIKTRTFHVKYQLTAEPTSGGAQVVNFDIHLSGVQQTKSQIQINTANAIVGSYIGGLFVLSTGDTLQLFKNNTTNTNDTNISVSTVLATLT